MKRIDSRTVYSGAIATVRIDRFEYEDGGTAEREIVEHPGAVAIVAHDDLHVWLVRQPREAVSEPALLEVPAGKLDMVGEPPVDCARRELAEEIGKTAERWEELKVVYASPGFAEEKIYIFLATDLDSVAYEPDPEERIEVVAWPLDDLGGAIDACDDSKSLIGLMILAQRLGQLPGPVTA